MTPKRPAGPKISVVIPCCNLGAYVDCAVSSCLDQTFQDLEILVVNDGSTDAYTLERLQELKRPRTRVVTTPNHGLARARNLGALETSGEYLCFLDADDRLHPEYFERAVQVLDAEPGLGFVSPWIEAFGDESWIYRPQVCDLVTVLADCTVATAALLRRQAFTAVGGFDDGMPAPGDEDWDLWIQLLVRGFTGTILPRVLFYYRRRTGSMVEDCYYGPNHLLLMDYLFAKYAPHYRRHFKSVLDAKRREATELEANRKRLAEHLDRELTPAVAAKRRELALAWDPVSRADSRSGSLPVEVLAAQEHAHHLVQALEVARGEVSALRGSLSWRLTAPLRLFYDGLAVLSPSRVWRPPYHRRLMRQERELLDLRVQTLNMERLRTRLAAELRFLDTLVATSSPAP